MLKKRGIGGKQKRVRYYYLNCRVLVEPVKPPLIEGRFLKGRMYPLKKHPPLTLLNEAHPAAVHHSPFVSVTSAIVKRISYLTLFVRSFIANRMMKVSTRALRNSRR